MPWAALEEALKDPLPPAPAAGGRPALPVRLMAGLRSLEHAYDPSDEAACDRWLENPYWRCFTGEVFFQTTLPCDASSLVRWRKMLGEAGLEELIVTLAHRHAIPLWQSHARQGPRLRCQAGGYAHAKQFKRLRRVLKRRRTVLGRLLRDGQRKLEAASDTARAAMTPWLERAQRLHQQGPKDKNKLYALHAPEVGCIGKGRRDSPTSLA
jgi:IS5 family transposase